LLATLRFGLLLLTAGAGAGSLAAPNAQAGEERVWLKVQRPYNGWVELGANPLLAVHGDAGSIGRGGLDLVVLMDVSRSTKNASGVDINGDGHLGGVGFTYRRDLWSWLNHPQTSSDPNDSILAAEAEAVRQLAQSFDQKKTRLGVISFSSGTKIESSIGLPQRDYERALRFLGKDPPSGRTNMARAIEAAAAVLENAPRVRGERHQRAILLVSDGRPTAPAPNWHAESLAIEAAIEARRLGIRIFTIGLGMDEDESFALREIARRTQGRFVSLADPGDVIEQLPRINLHGLADVDILNRTTGSTARALQVWSDGSFDAYVELAEGKNELHVTAESPDGTRTKDVRFVYFRTKPPRTDRERRLETAKLERLRDLLRARSVAVEIDRELNSARSGRERTVEVTPATPGER